MSWIRVIRPPAATGALREVYDRVGGPEGRVDNILAVHSLRPHTLRGHLALYKSVLHHTGNQLSGRLLETVGVYVSLLNGCGYCVEHHAAGVARLVDPDRAARIVAALRDGQLDADPFTPPEQAILRYARLLTTDPRAVTEAEVAALRDAGLDDGEILEVNQVVAYFAYANRTVLGLGVTTEGDELGLSPTTSDRTDDWRHQ